MHHRLLSAALVLPLTVAALALGHVAAPLPTAQACGSYMPSYTGVVKAVDLSRGKVIITYRSAQPDLVITTASFTAHDRAQLAELRAKDHVVFEFLPADEQGRYALSSIRVVQRASEAG